MTTVMFDSATAGLTDREIRERDEAKTGRLRCIGCGRFLADDANWNQCADCDTRSDEGIAYGGWS